MGTFLELLTAWGLSYGSSSYRCQLAAEDVVDIGEYLLSLRRIIVIV